MDKNKSEELRPALSWGDALLFIARQDKEIHELKAEIDKICSFEREAGLLGRIDKLKRALEKIEGMDCYCRANWIAREALK